MTNLTTTLEMSKRLKADGWSKETYFYYEENPVRVRLTIGKASSFRESITGNKYYAAVTITELLEELDNNTILQYENDVMVGLPVGDFIDLFRSPDKLADCWIWAKQQNLLGRDKERMK